MWHEFKICNVARLSKRICSSSALMKTHEVHVLEVLDDEALMKSPLLQRRSL